MSRHDPINEYIQNWKISFENWQHLYEILIETIWISNQSLVSLPYLRNTHILTHWSLLSSRSDGLRYRLLLTRIGIPQIFMLKNWFFPMIFIEFLIKTIWDPTGWTPHLFCVCFAIRSNVTKSFVADSSNNQYSSIVKHIRHSSCAGAHPLYLFVYLSVCLSVCLFVSLFACHRL